MPGIWLQFSERDQHGEEHAIIGVGRPAAGRESCKFNFVCLWAYKEGFSGAQRLRISNGSALARRGEKPKEFRPHGAFEMHLSISIPRTGEFDIRPEICCKLAGAAGLQHGAQVAFHGRLFRVVGAAYYCGRPQLWFERDGKHGATIFVNPELYVT